MYLGARPLSKGVELCRLKRPPSLGGLKLEEENEEEKEKN